MSKRERVYYVVLIAAGVFLISAASYSLLSEENEYARAREEYNGLRGIFYGVLPDDSDAPVNIQFSGDSDSDGSDINISGGSDNGETDSGNSRAGSGPASTLLLEGTTDPFDRLTELNSDFIGWISIDGLIDYPVVQTNNNWYYINRTFLGEDNPAGAIFMDSRHRQGFASPVCILYGHNSWEGSMFAPLHNYRNAEYMESNPCIYITTPEREVLVYRVFAAIVTDAWDSVYGLDYQSAAQAAAELGAPEDVSRLLILSTCTSNNDRDERLLVFSAPE